MPPLILPIDMPKWALDNINAMFESSRTELWGAKKERDSYKDAVDKAHAELDKSSALIKRDSSHRSLPERVALLREQHEIASNAQQELSRVVQACHSLISGTAGADDKLAFSALDKRVAGLCTQLENQAKLIRHETPLTPGHECFQCLREEIVQLKSTLHDKNLQIISLQSAPAPRLHNTELLADLQERLRKAAGEADDLRARNDELVSQVQQARTDRAAHLESAYAERDQARSLLAEYGPGSPDLSQRVQKIESRENALARLFSELTEVETLRNKRAAEVRATPYTARWKTSAISGRRYESYSRPLMKDDPEYRALVQRWEGITAAIRRIRSTSLSAS